MFSQFVSHKRDLETDFESLTFKDQAALLKVSEIADKWVKKPDCEGKRFVSSILKLYKQSNVVLSSVLTDSLDSFRKNMQQIEVSEKQCSLLFWFEVACLCGSENIVFDLLERQEIDICNSNNAIAYALSSGNSKFAINLANFAKTQGVKEPGNIFLYNACRYTDLLVIDELFNSTDRTKCKI